MKLPIQRIAKGMSKSARRALTALLITGSTFVSFGATIGYAEQWQSSMENRSTEDRPSADVSNHALDYWIFSDDYCGWASVEALTAPYSVDPFAVEAYRPSGAANGLSSPLMLTNAADVVDRTLAAAAERNALLSDMKSLVKNEPVDVTDSRDMGQGTVIGSGLAGTSGDGAGDAKEGDTFLSAAPPAVRLLGSSPVIVSIDEGYLPYDLNRSDAVGIKMYPITIPQFANRQPRPASLQGPLDCLGHGVIWNEQASPVINIQSDIATNDARSDASPSSANGIAARKFVDSASMQLSSLYRTLADQQRSQEQAAEQVRRDLAKAVVKSVQPDSSLRRQLSPLRLGRESAIGFSSALALSEQGIQEATSLVARSIKPTVSSQPEPVPTAGERLLVRAGIEANNLEDATAGVAVSATPKVCCPVDGDDVAALRPFTFDLAAGGMAAVTLQKPQVPSPQREQIVKAEAFATACDSAAEALERFALALRRAGDSAIRVARTNADGGTEIR